jgi:prepilin-type N-terminal cleavage/methylation domain-containing protein
MRRINGSDEGGFTLIEVMVAALILVLAFTALGVLFIGGQNESSAAVEESQVINIADQQMEQIRGEVNNGGFDKLGVNVTPTVASQFQTAGMPSTVLSTYQDPDAFVFSGASSTPCFDINENYDDVTAGVLANEIPPSFSEWSNCSTYGEPLVELGSSAMITEGTVSSGGSLPSGVATNACPTSSSGTIYSPCYVQQNPNGVTNTAQITYLNVYTFVTDTYVGCGTGSGTGTGTITTAAGTACPTINASNGIIQASSCTFPTTSLASTPCADARRVTVAVSAVQVHKQLNRATPVYISSIFTNPNPTTTSDSSIGLTLQGAL